MERTFLDALSRAGIPATHGLILDGKLRRYRVSGDKKGRKNGWYRYVQVTSDYAWGVFGCNKRQVNEKWSSKEPSTVTEYEKKERRKQEREIKAQEEELRGRAAVKANKIWGWLPSANSNHPYLLSKGIKSQGDIRQSGSALVLPVWVDTYIVSLQFIYPDGTKRYLTGGQKEGGFCWIGQETETIYLAEGWATASSVHEAIGKQVVVCFDASNLPTVAGKLRTRLPNAKLVIAADNDQWTKGNPGVSKAQECAKETGAEIKIPPFSYEDKSHPTDWNDYHRLFGLKALAEELLGLNKVAVVPSVKPEHAWRMQLIEGSTELPGFRAFDAKSKKNAYLFLKHHELYKNMVAYNVFSDQMMVVRCPPWEREDKFMPRTFSDSDAFMAAASLEDLGLKVKDMDAFSALRVIATEQEVNPPRDYFEALKWDGTPRLDKWLTYYLGCEAQPPEYLALVGAKWMIAAVRRIYEPGSKFDNVLILEGKQGLKKTSVFEKLATFNGETYFLEFMGSVSGRDPIILMQGNLIVEMAELATMKKTEIEEMRGFISRKVDEYRPPYGRLKVKRKRFFVLGATSNNLKEDGYLVDPSGNRRYWPAECGTIDLEALERDREQLWAEAVVRYQAGERTWLEGDEKMLAESEQAGREAQDVWLEPVKDFLIGRLETTVHMVQQGIGLTTEQKNSKNEKRIVKCLRQMGWRALEKREQTEHGRLRVWTSAADVLRGGA